MNQPPLQSFVMIADVAGSTALYEKLNEREAARAIERCIKKVSRSIEAYNGRLVRIVGDELLALFDSAETACQAAIDMQQRISVLPPVCGLKLGIRVALHRGRMTADGIDPSPEALTSTVRIIGFARREQILCSQAVFDALPRNHVVYARPKIDPGHIPDNGQAHALFQIHWPPLGHTPSDPANVDPPSSQMTDRLCVTYQGRTYVLDEHNPVLTLGRDPASGLVISDRKASRQHARIEWRADGFHLLDSSTNGSFVTIAARQEVMVHRHELLLEKSGIVCFGSSANDSAADRIAFEHQ